MLLLDLPGKFYKHRYNCFFLDRFWTDFFSLVPTSDGVKILKFIFLRNTTKTRNTRTHWRLQILSRKKWRNSDWIILTARHSTVEWVLHSELEGGIKKTIASLQPSPTAILPRPIFSRVTRSSFLFPSPSDACHAGYFSRSFAFVIIFPFYIFVYNRSFLNIRDFFSSGNAESTGDTKTCEKIGERTSLGQKFTNIEQHCRKPRFLCCQAY